MKYIINNNGRIKIIDIAKGIGILLVVLGHSMQVNSYPLRVIYSFHMPLFFLLSGVCYNAQKYTFLTLFRARIKSLFIPLLLFSTILKLLQITILNYPLAFSIWGIFPFSMWFIFVLFLTELCGYFIVKLPLLIALVIGLISVILYYYNLNLPYSLSCLPAAIMFYTIGYKLSKYIISFNKYNFNLIREGAIILLILIYAYFNPVYLDMCNNILPIISIMIAIMGVWITFMFSKIIGDLSISDILIFLGKNTFIIMAVHQFFMYIATIYIKPYLYDNFISIACFKIIQQLIMWGGILLSIWFVNYKARWLIGK